MTDRWLGFALVTLVFLGIAASPVTGAAHPVTGGEPSTVPTTGAPTLQDADGTNAAPTAVLSVSTTTPAPGEVVAFDGSASTDPDGVVVDYRWDFDGDGAVDLVSQRAIAGHTYAAAGTRTATLTVVDDVGATNTTAVTVDVGGAADAPAAVGTATNPPTDPDGDGRYEDVNGDGDVNVLDVQSLFVNLGGQRLRDSPAAFDFNGDGDVNVLDVQALFVQT